MAFLSPSLAMSWSKWNAKAPSHQIVFQAVESLDGKPIKEDAWKLYLSSSRSAQLPMIEEDKEFSDLPKENTEVQYMQPDHVYPTTLAPYYFVR
eukprot:m.98634 g.98634  ORF g.98634 m.98634 type:complete len:94 (+) comp36993_c0_seq2:1946-2227(+)